MDELFTVMNLLLTPEEMSDIDAAAAERGISSTELVRDAIFNDLAR